MLDFMSDVLETGRRFRVFNVEDQLTREGGLPPRSIPRSQVRGLPARSIGSWPSVASQR